MSRRLFFALVLVLAALLGAAPASGGEGGGVDVVVVQGLLEDRMIDFVIDSVTSSDAAVVVIQLDSPATLGGDLDDLLELLGDAPVPVAVWAGPDPARVAGGAARILAAAPVRGGAPGVTLGPAAPTFAGAAPDGETISEAHPDLPSDAIGGEIVIEDGLDGFFDLVVPSIGQFVVGLDGMEVSGPNGAPVVLETAEEEIDEDGISRIVPSVPVTFLEPGIVDRTIRLGITPEAAFFFVVAGLCLVAFEFYAVGPGLAAATAAVALLLGGYGIAVLPVRWWAVALIPLGLLLYTIDFQRNDLGWKSVLGTGALVAGGLFLTDAAPQIVPSWWVVGLVVLAAALWFGFALTTVVRARFSTQTIGRDHLVGRFGVADSAIAPDGMVTVDGARWAARSSRASGIESGDPVRVVSVEGVTLEVEPLRD